MTSQVTWHNAAVLPVCQFSFGSPEWKNSRGLFTGSLWQRGRMNSRLFWGKTKTSLSWFVPRSQTQIFVQALLFCVAPYMISFEHHSLSRLCYLCKSEQIFSLKMLHFSFVSVSGRARFQNMSRQFCDWKYSPKRPLVVHVVKLCLARLKKKWSGSFCIVHEKYWCQNIANDFL